MEEGGQKIYQEDQFKGHFHEQQNLRMNKSFKNYFQSNDFHDNLK